MRKGNLAVLTIALLFSISVPVYAAAVGVPLGSNTIPGRVKCDGVTTTCAADGTMSAVGAVASSIDAGGATTVTNGANGTVLTQAAGAVAEQATTGTGNVVRATSPTLVTPALGTPASGTLTNTTGLPLTTGVTGLLPVASGGTGTASPGIVAGANVTVTGTWPNQTVNASGGGGSVSVTAATPNIVINPTPGTGTFTVGSTASLNAQTGTTYTVLTGDNTKLVTLSNASPIAVTLPQAGSVGFLSGWSACFVNSGAGLATITTTTSTINGNGQTAILPQGASGCLASDGTNYSGTIASIKIPGTSGGIPYYAATNELLSSPALTANLPVIGGGAGAAPTVGTRSGNTTAFVTTTGTLTANNCVKIDASGNFIDNGTTCGGASGTITIGSTVVSGGTNGNCLTITTGTVGNQACGAGGSTMVAPQGRLTLVTGTPVMTSDQVAKSTIYYVCSAGNVVFYFTGAADAADTIASCQVSLNMVAAASAGQVTTNGVFDIWWVHSGANRICIAMSSAVGGGGGWASDTGGSNTARGTGYSQVHNTRGYWTNVNAIANCFNGATNYGSVAADQATYLGTVYSTAAGQTGMQIATAAAAGGANPILGLWNAYNRVPTKCRNLDATASWTYGTSTWREADATNAAGKNRCSWVDGLAQSSVSARYTQLAAATGPAMVIGVDLDSTSATPETTGYEFNGSSGSINVTHVENEWPGQSGFHFVSMVEFSTTASTYTAYGATNGQQANLFVDVGGM